MFRNQGKLIVLEGADGSGKGTQARLLSKSIQEYAPAAFLEFPRYKKSAFGKLIGQCLAGKFGNFVELSPYLSSLPYILDRARAKYLLLESLKDGHVICDRYTPSNIAHQAVKLPESERQEFIDFIEKGEYEELGLPAPDLVIYLYVPAEISSGLVTKKSLRDYLNGEATKDQHEEDPEYQRAVVEMYLWLAKHNENWRVVNCMEKGKLLSREEIHLKVMKIVKKELHLH